MADILDRFYIASSTARAIGHVVQQECNDDLNLVVEGHELSMMQNKILVDSTKLRKRIADLKRIQDSLKWLGGIS